MHYKRNRRYSGIDPGPSIVVDVKYLLLVISVAMAVNTYRLHGKWQRRENAWYDGRECRVTAFDVGLSAAIGLAAIVACVHAWWNA